MAHVVTRILERPGGLARLKDPRSYMVMLGVQRNRKLVTGPRTVESMFAVENKANEEETSCTHG